MYTWKGRTRDIGDRAGRRECMWYHEQGRKETGPRREWRNRKENGGGPRRVEVDSKECGRSFEESLGQSRVEENSGG